MKTTIKTLFLGTCLISLSGCSWFEDWSPRQNKSATYNASSAPPPGEDVRVVQVSGGTWLDSKKADIARTEPLVFSTSQTGALPPPAARVSDSQPDVVMPASSAAAASVEQRLALLESRVAQIHNTMEKMLPALTHLASIEKDLQNALNMIQPAAGGDAYVPAYEPPQNVAVSYNVDEGGEDLQRTYIPRTEPLNAIQQIGRAHV